MRRAGETTKEAFDIGFGSTGDDDFEPRSSCGYAGQGLQDFSATLIVATLIKCVNDKGATMLIRLARHGEDKIEEVCVCHRLSCQVWFTTKLFCHNPSKGRGDFGEFIDESWKDVSRIVRIRVISLAEKRSNELILLIECFTD